MPPYIHDTSNISYHHIPNFKFQDGTVLDIKIAYREWNPKGGKSVLIPTAMGGHLSTTHPFNSSPSEPFFSDASSPDPSQGYHVIIAAMLSNGESSSPSHYPPSTSSQSSLPKFPSKISYVDVVRAHHDLLTHGLGLKSLDVVLGTSMGGQQAWYWACLYGTGATPFVKNIVPICTSAKTSAHNVAMLDGLIAALETPLRDDELYQTGRDQAGKKNEKVLQALRAWHRGYAAWLTSPEWFRRGLWREVPSTSTSTPPSSDGENENRGGTYSTLQEYLNPEGTRYETWAPIDLIYLARMWQDGDVGECLSLLDSTTATRTGNESENEGKEGGEDKEERWKAILPLITSRVLLMPSTTDQYFRIEDAREQFQYLRSEGDGGAKHEWAPIETWWGHLPLTNPKDRSWIGERVKRFLE